MAVGNPVMQRMLSERRTALGMPPRDPQESDPTRQQPSNPTNYFENIRLRRNLRYDGRLTTKRLSTLILRNTRFTTNLQRILP
ncbi:hypothetical protein YC2023_076681 [Brassica napus]